MKSLFCLFALAAPAFGALTVSLPGTSNTQSWSNLKIGNPTPVNGAHASDSGSAIFSTISGSPLFTGTGSGIYSGFATGAVFSIADSGLADANHVAVQMRLVLQNGPLPTNPIQVILNGNSALTGTLTSTQSEAVTGDGIAAETYDFAWIFDLSSVETVTSFQVQLSMNTHTVISSSSPVSLTIAVPEPSSALLGFAALGLTCIRRRRA